MKGLGTPPGPLPPLDGATRGCGERKGSRSRAPVLHSWLPYRLDGVEDAAHLEETIDL